MDSLIVVLQETNKCIASIKISMIGIDAAMLFIMIKFLFFTKNKGDS